MLAGSSWYDLVKNGYLIRPTNKDLNVYLAFQLTHHRVGVAKKIKEALSKKQIGIYGIDCNGKMSIAAKKGDTPKVILPCTVERLNEQIQKLRAPNVREGAAAASAERAPNDTNQAASASSELGSNSNRQSDPAVMGERRDDDSWSTIQRTRAHTNRQNNRKRNSPPSPNPNSVSPPYPPGCVFFLI